MTEWLLAPTTEQVQRELDAARARIAELETAGDALAAAIQTWQDYIVNPIVDTALDAWRALNPGGAA
jgi:hypothetical protein